MKTIILSVIGYMAIVICACNDSATTKQSSTPDTTIRDTISTKIVTQGGMIDSLRIGASDTSAKKK